MGSESVPRVLTIGNADVQRRFATNHAAFLEEYTLIYEVLRKTFLRTLRRPPAEEVERLLLLPEDDPQVLEIEKKRMADIQIFVLGRTAADDFAELFILAANGYGTGAFKILRGMYERIVTAGYLAIKPAEARDFADNEAIEKKKLWREYVVAMPELKHRISEDRIQRMEKEYDEARVKRKTKFCSKCNQPITTEAWTRVSIRDMAEKVDPQLVSLYAEAYLTGTFLLHPTAHGISARVSHSEQGFMFRDTTEDEATHALIIGHQLILRLLTMQDGYFGLGLSAEVKERTNAYFKVWKRDLDKQSR